MSLRFSLNPRLTHDTSAPPVPIASQWASSFPSPDSPFHGASAAEASSLLLNLAQGVPGHPPPDSFLERLASEEKSHGYVHVLGEPALREALAKDVNRVYRGETASREGGVSMDEVAITAGCNLAFALTAQSLAGAEDAICLPTPWVSAKIAVESGLQADAGMPLFLPLQYFNHEMTLSSLGIRTIPLATHAPSYVPDPAAFQRIVASEERLRALVLVTPNNPTGSIYPRETIGEFARICREHRIALVLDETYRDFLVDDQGAPSRPHDLFLDSLAGLPDWDWRQTLIHLHSFSKSYAIPGHRLGAIICDRSLLISPSPSHDKDSTPPPAPSYGPILKALDNTQICAPRADTQRVVSWAIEGTRDWRTTKAQELRSRRLRFEAALQETVDVQASAVGLQSGGGGAAAAAAAAAQESTQAKADRKSPSDLGWTLESCGAYYAFVRHPFARTTGSEEVARALAELVGVVVLPGSFFMPSGAAAKGEGEDEEGGLGSRDRLRVSIANVSQERLDELPGRLVLFSQLWAHRV